MDYSNRLKVFRIIVDLFEKTVQIIIEEREKGLQEVVLKFMTLSGFSNQSGGSVNT